MTTKDLSIEEIEHVAYRIAHETMQWGEPIPNFLTRYPNVLESCLATPFQIFNGKDLYPGLLKKAAILFYLMIKNHPFENGNKRIAMTTLLIFLYKNSKWINIDNKRLYALTKSVAESLPQNKKKVVQLLEQMIRVYIADLNLERPKNF